MVASRKAPASNARPPRETMEAKFARVMAEPAGAPFPKLTKREARYFLRKIWETGDPDEPSGEEIMRDFYGDWSEDEATD